LPKEDKLCTLVMDVCEVWLLVRATHGADRLGSSGLRSRCAMATRCERWRSGMSALGARAGSGLLAALLVQCSPAAKLCPQVEVPPSVTGVTANPESGSAPLEVILEATVEPGCTDGCCDKSIPIESFGWDLDGDQTIDVTGLDATAYQAEYPDPGAFTAAAWVADDSRPRLAEGAAVAECTPSQALCASVTITVW
jgi:hypothetical protein